MNILSKIRNLINIGKITKQSSTPQIKCFDSEIIDQVPYYQQHGIASIPLNGTTVLLMSPNGDKSNPVIIGDNTSSPITLQPGESIIYKDASNYIHIKDNGDIDVKTTTFNIDTGDIDIAAGVLKIAGTQVVGTQQPLIAPPSGGSNVDPEARAAIALIITTLQTHGLTL